MTPRSLMVLPSIAACRKALTYLEEVGATAAVEVALRSVPCSGGLQHSSGKQPCGEHRIVALDDRTLQCRVCGKRFRSGRRELTAMDRVLFSGFDPSIPFEQRIGNVVWRS